MADDQEIVEWLQRRWPKLEITRSRCRYHSNHVSVSVSFTLSPSFTLYRPVINSLHLCGLQLTQVPPEVWQCSSLREFYLSNNQFSVLPAEVGQFTALQTLNLSNNQLSVLPAEVGNLTKLQMLDLDNNPWQSPLADIIREPPLPVGFAPASRQRRAIPAILAYLRTLQKKKANQESIAGDSSREKDAAILKEPLPIKIFYCYAHEDKDLRDRIDKHLGVLKRLEQVTGWYDREIQAGTEWEREIEAHLITANIILLLVSSDFVNSDYCYGVEMQKALEMHEKGKAHVLPILLRPVY